MNTPQTVFLVVLNYKLNFRDSDCGDCYAGDGKKNIRAFSSLDSAKALVDKMNPVISAAENETIIFPVQKWNRAVKKEFGFILDRVERNGYEFKLAIEEIEILPK